MRILFTVDCERLKFLEQGPEIYKGMERWKFEINKAISGLRYNPLGYEIISKWFMEERRSVTLMLVGSMFKPQPVPIQKKGRPSWIEYGYHSYSHKRLITLPDKEMEKEVKNIYNLKSFTAPGWETDKRIENALYRQGYKLMITRGGSCTELKSGIINLSQLGVIKVPVSATWNGTMKEAQSIVASAVRAADREEKTVFCISTHDFVHHNTLALDYLKDNLNEFRWVRMLGLFT